MPLILKPKFNDLSRAEIEAHVAAVQSRRMVAAIEYFESKNLKIAHESDKVQRRITGEYTMLGKEIERLDRADEAVQKRLAKIEEMKAEYGLLVSMITDTE